MRRLLEKLIVRLWNRTVAGRRRLPVATGLLLGFRVVDEAVTGSKVTIPHSRRATHIALLGRTGTGKSSLIRWFCEQDIKAGRGFFVFDIHGELTPALLALIAAEEQRLHADLSDKVIVVDPVDAEFSVGLNPLDVPKSEDIFLRVTQFGEVLEHRWGLQAFGARTNELLRNALLALAENKLTLLELDPLLTDRAFRRACMTRVTNAEIRHYFERRYDTATEPMQAVLREPILNKTSAFTADPRFRFIVGPRHSSFSLTDAMDERKWVIANLAKGRLGSEAITLGALLLTSVKHAAFARRNRELVTVYADEMQNLVGYGTDLETMFGEARKFGLSICTANQYLEQLPTEMRAALLAIGTHIFFQLSPPDAQSVASALDGGKPLAERLKNLPRRHLIVKSGSDPLAEVAVPELREPRAPWRDLYDRSRKRWGKPRAAIEAEISARQAKVESATEEALDGWE
jgi:DNA helicase HerA-like ATPase